MRGSGACGHLSGGRGRGNSRRRSWSSGDGVPPKRRAEVRQLPRRGALPRHEYRSIARYPVRLAKRARREQNVTVFMLTCGGAVAIRRRPKRGLLAGLWELPNAPEALGEQEALDRAAEWGARPLRLIKAVSRTHVFTHIVWGI